MSGQEEIQRKNHEDKTQYVVLLLIIIHIMECYFAIPAKKCKYLLTEKSITYIISTKDKTKRR